MAEILQMVPGQAAQPEQPLELIRWMLVYEDQRQVLQYPQLGGCLRFGDQDPMGINSVHVLRYRGDGVPPALLCVLGVPEGAKVEIYYRTSLDMSTGAQPGEAVQASRVMLVGWRMHDGSRRESWMHVQDNGVVICIPDPERPWPDEEADDVREPGATA